MESSFKNWGLFAAFALASSLPSWAIDVQVSDSPTNDLGLTISAIQGAQSSIFMNIYELSSPEIADAIVERINAGVRVEVLEEGQPVGGLSTAAKAIKSQIVQAMRSGKSGQGDHFYVMTSKTLSKRRYRFDHAKYAVIDEKQLLIGSENYSPSGNPQPGTLGNRGWEVLVADPSLAGNFEAMFKIDADLSKGDVTEITSMQFQNGNDQSASSSQLSDRTPSSYVAISASQVKQITSPDNSLSSLEGLIQNATSSIDIEQMTFDPNWGKSGSQNPLLGDLLDAARRGVKVRVLLNDESVFDHGNKKSTPKNPVTMDQLNQAAQKEGLNLQVQIANVKAMGVDYIHNKGMLIDSDLTLISSINWDQNSMEHNRETAVVITSPDVYSHYEALFNQDWNASRGQSNIKSQRYSYFSENTESSVSMNCPESVSVRATIGQLQINDSEDRSFAALSGKTFVKNFVQDSSIRHRSCLYLEADLNTERTNQRFAFEIRPQTNQTVLFILEGYTSGGKLFSIRGHAKELESLRDANDASLYDGSGASRDRLGPAQVELQWAAD